MGDYVVPETPCVIGANTSIREGQGKDLYRHYYRV